MKATIFDIERSSYVDGPGIRTTVFFKGCNLRCGWCHNPESQLPRPQVMLYKNRCTGCGKCKEKCPNGLEDCELCGECTVYCPADARELCGRELTVREVMNEILKDMALYESSNGGVTFSGGECMLQIDFLEEILKVCKGYGIHTAVDTAGCVSYDYFERVIPYTDLFLYDIKCLDSERHKRYTGVGNELILANLKKLLTVGQEVWVRIPIVPSVNDTVEELQGIKTFLDLCGKPERVELLPYHAMGEHKYSALGMRSPDFSVPSQKKMSILKEVFIV